MELWKDIQNYEGLYQISTCGRVKSFRRCTKYHCSDEYFLAPHTMKNGYMQVTLYSRNKAKRKFLIHRLVADAFLPNPNALPQINHKDENKQNNHVENLEWCTAEYNNAYGTAKLRSVDTKSRPVEQITIDGKVLAVYRSTRIAAELLGIKRGTLKSAIITKSQLNGHYWRYSSVSL